MVREYVVLSHNYNSLHC